MSSIEPRLPYRDFDLGSHNLGYPQLCDLPNGNLLASTWMGCCLEISPKTGRVTVQPRIGDALVPSLTCPVTSIEQPILCNAATHVVWAEFWKLGASEKVRVVAEDAVNSVALTANGRVLAVGLGMYPLNSAHDPHAVVELFSTSDPSKPIAQRVLPGVAVDRLALDSLDEHLIAVTGARTQDRGYVFVLDGQSLEIHEVAETGSVFCCSVLLDEQSNCLILGYRNVIQIRSLARLWNVEWEWKSAHDLFSAAFDAERNLIFLSDGCCLESEVGQVGRLPSIPDCMGVALLADGRLAGIS